MRSIRSKALAAILLTTLLPALAVTALSYRQSVWMIEADYAALSQEMARTVEALGQLFLGAYYTHISAPPAARNSGRSFWRT